MKQHQKCTSVAVHFWCTFCETAPKVHHRSGALLVHFCETTQKVHQGCGALCIACLMPAGSAARAAPCTARSSWPAEKLLNLRGLAARSAWQAATAPVFAVVSSRLIFPMRFWFSTIFPFCPTAQAASAARPWHHLGGQQLWRRPCRRSQRATERIDGGGEQRSVLFHSNRTLITGPRVLFYIYKKQPSL